MKKRLSISVLAAVFSQAAFCADHIPNQKIEKFDFTKLYAGAGFNNNRIDTSTIGATDGKASGIQVFAGYEYGQRNGFDIAAEAGLIQTGEFYNGGNNDADGIWAAAVVSKDLPEVDDKLSALIRLGFGLGGDDGLLMGFGAQYKVQSQTFIRLEYLNKDISQSYQVNAIYKF